MKINGKKGIVHHVLFSVLLLLYYCGSHGAESQIKIYREKQDVFTNLKCLDGGEKCTTKQCNIYGADCVNGNNCMYCRCLEGRNTFVIDTKDGQGKCKTDLEIVPESGRQNNLSCNRLNTCTGLQKRIISGNTACKRNDRSGIYFPSCYRFTDHSSTKYVDYNTTISKLFISAPMFRENNWNCSVREEFNFTRDGFTWEVNSGGFVSITYRNDTTKELQISIENLKPWNGSLLKLDVSCGDKTHCVLLKLRSLGSYLKFSTTPMLPTTKASTEAIEEDQKEKSRIDRTNFKLVTIATLLPLAAILALGHLCYKSCRRHGHIESSKDDRGKRDQNRPPTLGAPSVPLSTLQPSTSNQSTNKQYEEPCKHYYKCIDKTQMAPSRTSTYDYASLDGPLDNNKKTSEELDGIGENNYVIKNNAEETSRIPAIEPKPDAKEVETHDDYVMRDELYVRVIKSEPEEKEVETRDDHVPRDESYVTVVG